LCFSFCHFGRLNFIRPKLLPCGAISYILKAKKCPLEVVRNLLGLQMSNKIKHLYEFEDFRLNTENPSLWRDGEMVSISPKALETLIVLVKKKGEIVSREELLESVWKETFVEEGNINYTISLLRENARKQKFGSDNRASRLSFFR
jgi:DNA-binding response OmpR family regulator